MRGKDLCNAIELSIRQNRLPEASAQAKALVQKYPGHLRGLFLTGVSLLRLGHLQQARLQLDAALGVDPENAECRLALAETLRKLGETEQATRQFIRSFALLPSSGDCALIFNGTLDALAELKARGEASPMGKASRFRLLVNWGHALSAFKSITHSDPFLPEAWLGLAESLWRLERLDEAMATLEQIATAWPNFVKASLISGDILIRQGQVEAGTASLHNAQALDPSGVVAQRTLGWQAQYAHLWADGLSVPRPQPQSGQARSISHSPSAQAPSTPAVQVPGESPTIREIELELKRLTDDLLKPDEIDAPVHPATASALVILTCRGALEQRFGPRFVERLGDAVQDLVRSIGIQENRAIHFVALDDPEQMRGLGGESPEDPTDSEQVRTAIESLSDGLLTQNSDLRHLLILGGDEIVPFCRVANPTDDQDEDIYTDAPYAARNGSYLLPTRAVGRLPDAGDGKYLLHLLESAAVAHRHSNEIQPPGGLKGLKRFLHRSKSPDAGAESVGYTASVWKEAARAAFETIGDPKHLRMSPPLTYREFSSMAQGGPRFSYFNLHGVEGEAVWYGQRDPNFSADYPLFPVALTPAQVTAGVRGTTVFTEACYGADILERTPQNSIALKFLAQGARAVIGSTRLAYGSLTPPLAGADLLARLFWLAVLSGMSIGQSFQWAKLSFANELLNRQGYLDAEDQKTLLTFNLFGDPTLAVAGQTPAWDKLPRAALSSKSPVLCCTHSVQPLPLPALPSEVVDHVQAQIAHRMPGLTPRQMKVVQQQLVTGDPYGARGAHPEGLPHVQVANRYVFSVNGTLQGGDDTKWHQIVKVTVDQRGTILKMAVSK